MSKRQQQKEQGTMAEQPAAASPPPQEENKALASDSLVCATSLASGNMSSMDDNEDGATATDGGAPAESGNVAAVNDTITTNDNVDIAVPSPKAAPSDIIHSKKQDFVLSFEDLTCYVPGIPSNCCVSENNPITNYLEYYLGMQVQQRDAFYSLDSCSGFVKSGEMCLVLGSNDASKSTLLRTLCDRLNTQDELYGTVLLDGMPLGRSNQGWRRLSPYVSASDGSHSPVLTVRETFTFAAQCSCTDPTKIQASVNQIMEALGLMNVADTVVGGESLDINGFSVSYMYRH